MKQSWIDRYVSEVARRLPKNQRDEVARELESTVLDELEDRYGQQPGEEQVLEALRELGPPATVAAGYHAPHQYLIGPAWYPTFRRVVLTVLSVHVAVWVTACAVSVLWPGPSFEPGKAVLSFLNTAVESATYSFGIILLIFFLLERSEFPQEAPETVWDPRSLPPAPASGDLVGRGEALLSLVLVAIFLSLLHIFRDDIGIPTAAGESILLNDVYQRYLPWLSLSLLLDMAIYAWLFWRGGWERGSRILHFAFDLVGLGVLFGLTSAVADRSAELAAESLPALVARLATGQIFWIPAVAAVIIAIEHGRVLLRALKKS